MYNWVNMPKIEDIISKDIMWNFENSKFPVEEYRLWEQGVILYVVLGSSNLKKKKKMGH